MALHVQGSLVFPSMTDRLSEFSCETRALFPLGDIHQWLWINSMHCKVCVCVWAREKRRQLRMPTIVILLNSQNCTTYISTNARFQPMLWTALLLPECILNKHGCPFFSLPWREFAAPIYMYVYIFCIRWAKWHMNAPDSVTVVVANEVQYISMLLCAARLASTHHRSDIISDTCCINACYECVHTHTQRLTIQHVHYLSTVTALRGSQHEIIISKTKNDGTLAPDEMYHLKYSGAIALHGFFSFWWMLCWTHIFTSTWTCIVFWILPVGEMQNSQTHSERNTPKMHIAYILNYERKCTVFG